MVHVQQFRMHKFWGHRNMLDLKTEKEKLRLLEESKLKASLWSSTLSESEAVSETVFHIREQCDLCQDMQMRHFKSTALQAKVLEEEQNLNPQRSKNRRLSIWQSVFDEEQNMNSIDPRKYYTAAESAHSTTRGGMQIDSGLSFRNAPSPGTNHRVEQKKLVPTDFELIVRDYCEANRTLGLQRLKMSFAPPHYGTEERVLREVEDVRSRYMRKIRPDVTSAIESLQKFVSAESPSVSLSSIDRRSHTRSRDSNTHSSETISPSFPRPHVVSAEDDAFGLRNRRAVSSSVATRLHRTGADFGKEDVSMLPRSVPPRTAPAAITRTLPGEGKLEATWPPLPALHVPFVEAEKRAQVPW